MASDTNIAGSSGGLWKFRSSTFGLYQDWVFYSSYGAALCYDIDFSQTEGDWLCQQLYDDVSDSAAEMSAVGDWNWTDFKLTTGSSLVSVYYTRLFCANGTCTFVSEESSSNTGCA